MDNLGLCVWSFDKVRDPLDEPGVGELTEAAKKVAATFGHMFDAMADSRAIPRHVRLLLFESPHDELPLLTDLLASELLAHDRPADPAGSSWVFSTIQFEKQPHRHRVLRLPDMFERWRFIYGSGRDGVGKPDVIAGGGAWRVGQNEHRFGSVLWGQPTL
jgi:hypothetical protein